MPRETAQRLSMHIAILGVVLTLGMGFRFGASAAISTGLGAVMGLLNWFILKWIVARLISGEVREKVRFMVLVLLKMAGYMGIAYLLLASGLASPIPFTVGVGALAGGLLLGSFQYIIFGKSDVAGVEPAGSKN